MLISLSCIVAIAVAPLRLQPSLQSANFSFPVKARLSSFANLKQRVNRAAKERREGRKKQR